MKLSLTDITIANRQRLDLGDLNDLVDSIRRNGLIEPVVVDQNNRLVAGERRYRAHELLGLPTIEAVYKETLSDDHLHEMEIEENVCRKNMSWQERVLAIETIHFLKKKRAALDGSAWGQRETQALLSINSGSVINYSLRIAKRLRAELGPDNKPTEAARFWKCDSLNEAWQLEMRDEEDLIRAELARRSADSPYNRSGEATLGGAELLFEGSQIIAGDQSSSLLSNRSPFDSKPFDAPLASEIPFDEVEFYRSIRQRWKDSGYENMNEMERLSLFKSFGFGEEEFDKFNATQLSQAAGRNTIRLSGKLINCNSIDWMLSHPASVDHVITDPPYGIDMDMLNQGNDGHAFQDIDTVVAEHDVKSNEELFTQFFPAAYSVLKSSGFCVLWCDVMQWQRLYDLAIAAGFKVQRWPIVWVKTHQCMNQSAQYNFTKSIELAMVCRKGTSTLVNTSSNCHVLASHDDYKDTLGHPFVKPFDIWNYILEHVSFEGQVVLDPFAGRGSGVISSIRTGRGFVGLEINTTHYNALLENVKQHYLTVNPQFTFV